MKTLQYKIIIALLSLGIMANAQKFDKKYAEEFNTNDNVVIDVDTRHTDIEIETWSKNKVIIEATIEIEGASKEKAEEIIKNWKFKALGNKNEIEITSKTNSLFGKRVLVSDGDDLIHINDFDFDFPEVSIENLAILDSLHIVMPDALHFPEPPLIPEIETFHFEFDAPEFDYEKYKNDENYLKQWQKKMKINLEKMQIKMKENSARMKENSAKFKEQLKEAQEERKLLMKERYKEMAKEREEIRKVQAEKRKEQAKVRKEVQEKRREELANRRIEIKNILADRDKIKIKRVIKIRAPKDAKFNMNVRYGAMSFPN